MRPDDPHHELDTARDPLLRALAALPRADLDPWRSERLRSRAHAELAHAGLVNAVRPIDRTINALELLLMAACGALGVGRLALALALIFGA